MVENKTLENRVSSCPSETELIHFSSGLLSEPKLEHIATHLETCSKCDTAIVSIERGSDSLISTLRKPTSQTIQEDAPELQRMKAAAKGYLQKPEDQSSQVTMPLQLGQYELLEKIGQGGMGIVYRALHLNLKREVAIKLLPSHLTKSQTHRTRFYREMAAVGRVESPYVVHANDAGEAEGWHYLVMEYVRGVDVGRLVRHVGPLPVSQACEIARQAALGLADIDRHALVHRDIKPSNLLLSHSGSVKISDLGLARLLDQVDEDHDLTGSGYILGTADYISPEQVSDARNIDVRADIYALGCTLFKLLTGQAPFSSTAHSSPHQKVQAHLNDPPPLVTSICPEVPNELATLIDKMLSKQPEQRFDSPQEVAKLLEPFSSKVDLSHLLRNYAEIAGDYNGLDTLSFAPQSTTRRETISGKAKSWQRSIFAIVLMAVAIGGYFLVSNWTDLTGVSPDKSLVTNPKDLPQKKTFEFLTAEQIEPQVQYPLLNIEPEKLFWTEGQFSNVAFQPALSQVSVNCQGAGVLSLGEISERPYVFSIDLYQSTWQGGVGIFWGFRTITEPNGPPSWQYQTLDIRANARSTRHEFPVVLWRNLVTVRLDKNGNPSSLTSSFASEPLKVKHRQAHQLEITVSRHRLQEVRWRGKPLDNLCDKKFDQEIPPGGDEGKFGIIVIGAEGVFSNSRFTLLRGVVP